MRLRGEVRPRCISFEILDELATRLEAPDLDRYALEALAVWHTGNTGC